METFRPALRRAIRELDLPRSLRSEVLRELIADLEAAFVHHRRAGLAEAEAARRAEEAVLGSPEAIRALAELHADRGGGGWPSLQLRLPRGVLSPLYLMVALPALVLGVGIAGWTLGRGVHPLTLALVAAGAAQIGLWGHQARRLLASRPVDRALLAPFPVFVATVAALSALSLAQKVQRVAEGVGPSGPAAEALLELGLVQGGLVLAGALVAIGGVVSWYALGEMDRLWGDREVEALFTDPPGGSREKPPTTPVVSLERRRCS